MFEINKKLLSINIYFKGVLDFSFLDTVVTRRSAGRIEVEVSHKTEFNNGIYYSILRTNPDNPVRNIRMFEERFEVKLFTEI